MNTETRDLHGFFIPEDPYVKREGASRNIARGTLTFHVLRFTLYVSRPQITFVFQRPRRKTTMLMIASMAWAMATAAKTPAASHPTPSAST